MGSYRSWPERLTVSTLRAKPAKLSQLRSCGRSYACDTLLQRLAQYLQHMAAALGQFIEKEHAVVGPRHLARQGHVAATDPPRVGNRLMRGAERSGRDQGGAIAGEAGDAVEAGGLNGLGEGHRREDGGEPAGQPRLPRPRRAQEENVVGTTPAFGSVSLPTPKE